MTKEHKPRKNITEEMFSVSIKVSATWLWFSPVPSCSLSLITTALTYSLTAHSKQHHAPSLRSSIYSFPTKGLSCLSSTSLWQANPTVCTRKSSTDSPTSAQIFDRSSSTRILKEPYSRPSRKLFQKPWRLAVPSTIAGPFWEQLMDQVSSIHVWFLSIMMK